MTEEIPQPISDERIKAAQDRITELCAASFKQGYATGHAVGYGTGFEAGVIAMTEQDDKRVKLA